MEALATVFHDHSDVKIGDMYPFQPIRFLGQHLDDLLVFCVAQKASDIKFYTNWPVKVKAEGNTFPVTDRPLTSNEALDFVAKLYKGDNGGTQLASGKDIDVPYEVRPDRFTRYRFRVSMTAMHVDGQQGVRMTLRPLASIPPSIEDLSVSREMVDAFLPSNGLVLVTGGTGSGKSTLLASIIRHQLEKKDSNLDILTYESPIEFVYDEVKIDPSALISQSEVPMDIRSFSLGIRNALRNNPDIILVGEMRDTETIVAGVEAAKTGHVLYGTLHSNDVASTVGRLLIGASESDVITVTDVLETLRVVVSQRLLKNPNGGRTAIRESKFFNQGDRKRLMNCDPNAVAGLLVAMVEETGTSFKQAAAEALAAGQIFQDDYDKIAIEAAA